jgi:hypothetical protein
LIHFESGPIDETGVMIFDQHGPRGARQMAHPFLQSSVRIDVTLLATFTIELVRKTGISEKARNTGKVLGAQRGRDALFFLRATVFQVF